MGHMLHSEMRSPGLETGKWALASEPTEAEHTPLIARSDSGAFHGKQLLREAAPAPQRAKATAQVVTTQQATQRKIAPVAIGKLVDDRIATNADANGLLFGAASILNALFKPAPPTGPVNIMDQPIPVTPKPASTSLSQSDNSPEETREWRRKLDESEAALYTLHAQHGIICQEIAATMSAAEGQSVSTGPIAHGNPRGAEVKSIRTNSGMLVRAPSSQQALDVEMSLQHRKLSALEQRIREEVARRSQLQAQIEAKNAEEAASQAALELVRKQKQAAEAAVQAERQRATVLAAAARDEALRESKKAAIAAGQGIRNQMLAVQRHAKKSETLYTGALRQSAADRLNIAAMRKEITLKDKELAKVKHDRRMDVLQLRNPAVYMLFYGIIGLVLASVEELARWASPVPVTTALTLIEFALWLIFGLNKWVALVPLVAHPGLATLSYYVSPWAALACHSTWNVLVAVLSALVGGKPHPPFGLLGAGALLSHGAYQLWGYLSGKKLADDAGSRIRVEMSELSPFVAALALRWAARASSRVSSDGPLLTHKDVPMARFTQQARDFVSVTKSDVDSIREQEEMMEPEAYAALLAAFTEPRKGPSKGLFLRESYERREGGTESHVVYVGPVSTDALLPDIRAPEGDSTDLDLFEVLASKRLEALRVDCPFGVHPVNFTPVERTELALTVMDSFRHDCGWNDVNAFKQNNPDFSRVAADELVDRCTTTIHRVEENHDHIRCGVHYAHTPHQWPPGLMAMLAAGGVLSDDFMPLAVELAARVRLHFERYVPKEGVIAVTSETGAYTVSKASPCVGFDHTVVMIEDGTEPPEIVVGKVSYLSLPSYAGGRSFASYRLLPAHVLAEGWQLMVVNREPTHLPFNSMPYVRKFGATLGEFSICPWTYNPSNMSCHFSTSGKSHDLLRLLFGIETTGFIYGHDEIHYLTTGRCNAIYNSEGGRRMQISGGVAADIDMPYRVNAVIASPEKSVMMACDGWSRSTLTVLHRLEVALALQFAMIKPTLWQTLNFVPRDDGTFIEMDLSEYEGYFIMPSAIVPSESDTLQERVGPIMWYTLGTTGDRNPNRAVARKWASVGFHVIMVHLNTEKEGKAMLARAEALDAEKDLPLAIRGLAVAGASRRFTVSPQFMHLPFGVRVNLAPPPEFVKPMRSSSRWIINVLNSLMDWMMGPHINIGCLKGKIGWLPRSHNGDTFLTQKANLGTFPVGIAMGSSSLPVPEKYKHAPLVPNGDHTLTFPMYSAIVCHGGAGTVQTAAACGCRVISVGDTLDRAARDPDNAGYGYEAGADPDLCFVALGHFQLEMVWVYMKVKLAKLRWFSTIRKPMAFLHAVWVINAWILWDHIHRIIWNLALLTWACIGFFRTFKFSYSLETTIFTNILQPEGLSGSAALFFQGAIAFAAWQLYITTGRAWYTWVLPSQRWVLDTLLSRYTWPAVTLFGRTGFLLVPLFDVLVPVVLQTTTQVAMMLIAAIRMSYDSELSSNSRFRLMLQISYKYNVPITHLCIVDTQRELVHEGQHLGEEKIGQEFEARFAVWNDREFKDGIYLPLDITEKTFDELPTGRRPYSASWNCVMVVYEGLRVTGFRGVTLLGALMIGALMFYASGVILVGTVIALFLTILVGLLERIANTDESVLPSDLVLVVKTMNPFDYRVDSRTALRFHKYSKVLRAMLTGFGGESEDNPYKYAWLEVDPEVLNESLQRVNMRFSVGASGLDPVAQAKMYWERFNVELDEVAFNREQENLKQAFPPGGKDTDEWKRWVSKAVERLIIQAGATTALAYQKWANSIDPIAMLGSEEMLRVRLVELNGEWPLHRRWEPAYIVAFADEQTYLQARLNAERAEELLVDLKPITTAGALKIGLGAPLQDVLRQAQSFIETGPPDRLILADYKLTTTRSLIEKAHLMDVEVFRRVADRGLTYDERWSDDDQHAFGADVTGRAAFDATLAWFQAIGKPLGWGLSTEEVVELSARKSHMTLDDIGVMDYLTWANARDGEPPDMAIEWADRIISSHYDSGESSVAIQEAQEAIGGLVAAAQATGFDPSVALESGMLALQHWAEGQDRANKEAEEMRLQILEDLKARRRQTQPISTTETVLSWIARLEELVLETPLLGDTIREIARLWHLFSGEMLKTGQAILEALLNGLVKLQNLIEPTVFQSIGSMFLDLIDILAAKTRIRPKAVWAPLFRKRRRPLTSGERLSMAITGPTNEIGSYEEALKDTIDRLRSNHPDEDPPELLTTFVRKVYRPETFYGTKAEFEGIEGAPELVKDEALEERVAGYLKAGAKQGIDGVWLSDSDANLRSMSRYEPEPHPSEPGLESLVIECAEVIFRRHPELFDRPEVITPEQVWRYIEKRYSPGIPFIGKYSTRRALYNSGWAEALMKTARQCLETGHFPAHLAHAFPKMQVVDKEKLLGGKAVRTVISQDLLTVFIDQCLFLERAKRPATTEVGIAIGRPLTEAGLEPFFAAVLKRKNFFKGDEKEYDSRTPPAIMAGLFHLAHLGFKGHANAANLSETARTSYMRLQKGYITELEGGETILKNRGGSTGQSKTSFDNTWGVRLKAIATWSVITGKKPEQFFETNDLINMSDDNMWGTDDELDPVVLSTAYEQLWGATLTAEAFNDINEMSFLGKLVEKGMLHEQDYIDLGMKVPEYAIRADVSNLLMRRSAFTTRVGGFKKDQHFRSRIMRTVGHAALCAHNRMLFNQMANEWMDDAREMLGEQRGSRLFEVILDGKNNIIAAKVRDGFKPASMHQASILNFLKKSGRLVDYLMIMANEVKPLDDTAAGWRARKLAKLGEPISTANYLAFFVQETRETIARLIPDAALGLSAEPDVDPLMMPVASPDYAIEHFIRLKFIQRHAVEPTMTEMLSVAKESPYRYVMDVPGYLWHIGQPAGRAEFDAVSLHEVRAKVWAVTVFYFVVNVVASRLAKVSSSAAFGLGAVDLFLEDLPRFYSWMNTIYWHIEGRSSARVSALMPKDSRISLKAVARITAFVLRHLTPIIPIPAYLETNASWLIDEVAKISVVGAPRNEVRAAAASWVSASAWASSAKLFLDSVETDDPFHVLTSATATGKSTAFPAAILAQTKQRQIWLLEPRNVLKDNYSNPFLGPDLTVARVTRDTILRGENLVVATYGAWLARRNSLDKSQIILLCDEFHESSPEQVAVEYLSRGYVRLFMSATPQLELYPGLTRVLESPVPRPFKVERVQLEMDVAGLFAEAARDHPDLIRRSLIILPTIPEVESMMLKLRGSGYEVERMTRTSRAAPKSGIIVATQVVDSGIDIDPPVDIVISSFEMIASDRGRVKRMITNQATMDQRTGRAGRRRDGYAYMRPAAGTGATPLSYPNWGLLWTTEDLAAHYLSLYATGVTFAPPAAARAPVMQNADPTRFALWPGARDGDGGSRFAASDMLGSLRIHYMCVAFTGRFGDAKRIYEDLRTREVYDEALAPVERSIKDMLATMTQVPYDHILGILDSNPYETTVNGVVWRHCGLRLSSSGVAKLGTPTTPHDVR